MQRISGSMVMWQRWLPMLSLVFATGAHAHHLPPGMEEVDEFATHGAASAVMHPFTGADHLLVALGVGWMAWSMGSMLGKRLLGAFIGSLFAGVILGRAAGSFAVLESGLAISVAVVGAVLAMHKSVPTGIRIGIVALVGGLHGMAHGSEAPASLGAPLWAAAMVMSTTVLCVLGVSMAHLMSRRWPAAKALASAALVMAGAVLWMTV